MTDPGASKVLQMPGRGEQPQISDGNTASAPQTVLRIASGNVETDYRRIVESANQGIWTIDLEGRTTYVNELMAGLLGVTPDGMMGRPHTDFMWEEDRPEGDEQLESRRHGQGDVWDQRYRRKDGTELWTLASCSSLFDHDGRTIGALGMFTDITERKRSERARRAMEDLQARDALFRAAFDQATVGMVLVGPDMLVKEVNERYCQIAGITREEAPGVRAGELTDPADRDAELKIWEALRLQKISQASYEKSYRLKSGATNRVSFVVSAIDGPDGKPARFLGIVQDITERNRAEEALRRSEEKFRLISDQAQAEKSRLSLVLDNIVEEVWFHDASGRVILTNPAAHNAFGDVDGREIAAHAASIDIFRPDGTPRPVTENPIVRALAGEAIKDQEEIVKWPVTGELRTRCVTSIPARGPDGAVLGVVTVVRDITAQAAADRALELNRARLDYATRLSGVGFWYCDLPFDELQWDERVKDHFFSPPSARITIDDFYARIHKEDRAATREAIEASIRNRTPYDIVYRTVHPTTGAVKWIRALGGTDYASDGTPMHFDGVTVDASAQKLAQQTLASLNQQLREQDQRKNEFLAMLAHEMRNPLAPIRNAAELCSRTIPLDNPAYLAIGIVKRQANQLARLVDDLLDVSRISQGRIDLKMEIVELKHLIEMARETVAPLMGEKQHELSISQAHEPVYVKGDSGRLVQAISNVLTNAAKYTQAHGRICVRTEVKGEFVAIEISDNGAGISADLLPRVFELFTQSERTLDRAQGGLGIGLSIVKQLLEMHGGQCVARSGGVGHGSTFEIILPRSHPIAEAALDPLDSSSTLRRILIIDDNVDAAMSLAEILKIEGHECEAVFSAHEGLERAATLRPDFVLLDIGLPGLDGYEVARRLQQLDGLEGVGLIALTGYGQPEDHERTRVAGFDAHFVKPLDFGELARRLAQGPSKRRRRTQD